MPDEPHPRRGLPVISGRNHPCLTASPSNYALRGFELRKCHSHQSSYYSVKAQLQNKRHSMVSSQDVANDHASF
jgi:hypothetical protein